MADYAKPLPVPMPESKPFWAGAKDHKLLVQKCDSCGTHRFPPSTVCVQCGAGEYRWVAASGRGRVCSFVTYHRLYHEAWQDEVPYVVAVVELEEGPRMISNIVGIEPDKVVCDMTVEVTFDDVTADVTLPKFRPA